MRESCHDLNRVALLGAVRDLSVRHAGIGGELAEFTVETSHRFDKGGRERTETTRVEVLAWNGLAEFVRHNVARGDRVYVAGRLREKPRPKGSAPDAPRSYEVIAERVIPHGGPRTSDRPDPEALRFQETSHGN